jgi:hypothetical protein
MLQTMLWSIIQILPTAILAYLGFHVIFYPVDESKKMKAFFLILIIVCIAGSVAIAVKQGKDAGQQQKDFSDQMGGVQFQLRQANTNNETLKEEVQSLKNEISTNAGIADSLRLVVLGDQYDRIVNENQDLQNQHELLDTAPVDLDTIRQKTEIELTQKTNDEKLAELQARMDDIKSKKQAESDAEAEKLAEERANHDTLEKEKAMTSLIAPIFDYTIVRFGNILAGLKTGEAVTGDFHSLAPNLSSSKLINQGILVENTNVIAIGTNAAWNFQITTTIDLNQRQSFPSSRNYSLPWSGAAINILANTTNSSSVLTIKPTFFSRNSRYGQMRFGEGKIKGDVWFYDITLTLNAGDGVNIGKSISSDNFTNEIDSALEELIGSEDALCPLKPK